VKNFERLEFLIGKAALMKLNNATVAVIGLGGVGGFCAVTLARCGIGNLLIQDYDIVEASNINRQIIANCDTVGKKKSDLLAVEIKKINPQSRITVLDEPFNESSRLFSHNFDYLADAIDDINNKYLLIKKCIQEKVAFISAMGAARKIDWRQLTVATIDATAYDPLAKIIRRKMRADGIVFQFPVVTSREPPQKTSKLGSYMPVTAMAGIIMADYIIKKIIAD